MTDQRADPPSSPTSPEPDGQVSQGPSGSVGIEQAGGADAVPDTPDNNFAEDADVVRPDRRGSSLEGGE